jgi:hypothetical protein
LGTLLCKILEFQYKCQKAWFEIKERCLNLKFKLHNTYNRNQTCNYMVRYYLNTIVATVTLGVSHWLPCAEVAGA